MPRNSAAGRALMKVSSSKTSSESGKGRVEERREAEADVGVGGDVAEDGGDVAKQQGHIDNLKGLDVLQGTLDEQPQGPLELLHTRAQLGWCQAQRSRSRLGARYGGEGGGIDRECGRPIKHDHHRHLRQ